jgi:hypothetical protein
VGVYVAKEGGTGVGEGGNQTMVAVPAAVGVGFSGAAGVEVGRAGSSRTEQPASRAVSRRERKERKIIPIR